MESFGFLKTRELWRLQFYSLNTMCPFQACFFNSVPWFKYSTNLIYSSWRLSLLWFLILLTSHIPSVAISCEFCLSHVWRDTIKGFSWRVAEWTGGDTHDRCYSIFVTFQLHVCARVAPTLTNLHLDTFHPVHDTFSHKINFWHKFGKSWNQLWHDQFLRARNHFRCRC